MDNPNKRRPEEDADNSSSSDGTEAPMKRRHKRSRANYKKAPQFKAKKYYRGALKRRISPGPSQSSSDPQFLRSRKPKVPGSASIRTRLSYLNIDPGQTGSKIKKNLDTEDAVKVHNPSNEVVGLLSELSLDGEAGTSKQADKKRKKSMSKTPEKK